MYRGISHLQTLKKVNSSNFSMGMHGFVYPLQDQQLLCVQAPLDAPSLPAHNHQPSFEVCDSETWSKSGMGGFDIACIKLVLLRMPGTLVHPHSNAFYPLCVFLLSRSIAHAPNHGRSCSMRKAHCKGTHRRL